MNKKKADLIDRLLPELLNDMKVQEMISLPPPVFDLAFARLRQAHLEKLGVRFLSPRNPATCKTCEG